MINKALREACLFSACTLLITVRNIYINVTVANVSGNGSVQHLRGDTFDITPPVVQFPAGYQLGG